MKVLIAADHGGFELKEHLKKYLDKKSFEIEDLGNTKYDSNDDYPEFVLPLAERISKEGGIGIVLGRSGNGEAIAANKVKGIRAALCLNPELAKKARRDNHANVVALGGDFVDKETAEKIVDAFIETEFSQEERHARRVGKITSYESSNT
jgi:ribose 5-phosphate isomerase B